MAKIIIDPFTGVKHLPGSGLCSTVTACGEIDQFEIENGPEKEGIDADGLPDCAGCIDIALILSRSITKKELKKCITNRSTRTKTVGDFSNAVL